MALSSALERRARASARRMSTSYRDRRLSSATASSAVPGTPSRAGETRTPGAGPVARASRDAPGRVAAGAPWGRPPRITRVDTKSAPTTSRCPPAPRTAWTSDGRFRGEGGGSGVGSLTVGVLQRGRAREGDPRGSGRASPQGAGTARRGAARTGCGRRAPDSRSRATRPPSAVRLRPAPAGCGRPPRRGRARSRRPGRRCPAAGSSR
ncbi:MAG: hypothetical protein JWM27_4882 [Gemmatimonadetes bacterium]|nr:hypothetical protein [Gemmatimonadota bacterium]